MNVNLKTFLRFAILPILLISLLTRPLPANAASQAVAATGWIDHFDSTTLHSRWSWVREDPARWSLAGHPGFLRLVTQTGGVYGSTSNDQKNILMAAPLLSDFQMTTRIEFNPTENFQYAGIMLY